MQYEAFALRAFFARMGNGEGEELRGWRPSGWLDGGGEGSCEVSTVIEPPVVVSGIDVEAQSGLRS